MVTNLRLLAVLVLESQVSGSRAECTRGKNILRLGVKIVSLLACVIQQGVHCSVICIPQHPHGIICSITSVLNVFTRTDLFLPYLSEVLLQIQKIVLLKCNFVYKHPYDFCSSHDI
jgi:hypothetical protein